MSTCYDAAAGAARACAETFGFSLGAERAQEVKRQLRRLV